MGADADRLYRATRDGTAVITFIKERFRVNITRDGWGAWADQVLGAHIGKRLGDWVHADLDREEAISDALFELEELAKEAAVWQEHHAPPPTPAEAATARTALRGSKRPSARRRS